jgi:hypothetical protein
MVVHLSGKSAKRRAAMPAEPQLRFVYLTMPEQTAPVLNVNDGANHMRFKITRDQLFQLNAQIADALVKGSISDRNSFNEQLVLSLEKAATL